MRLFDEDAVSHGNAYRVTKTAAPRSRTFRRGDAVRITAGPLAGIDATLIEVTGTTRLLLAVIVRQKSVLIEIDRGWVARPDVPA